MKDMMDKMKRFLAEEQGQDMAEYSLLLLLIGTVVLIYLTGMGTNLVALLQQIGEKVGLVKRSIS
jgi:Flp pilus assembly pilin Flp